MISADLRDSLVTFDDRGAVEQKRCSVCTVVKSFVAFGIKRRDKSGIQRYDSRCRGCRSSKARSEEGRQRRRDYYQVHAAAIKRSVRQSYAKHQKARLAQKAEYRADNREEIKETKKKVYHRNLEVSRAKLRDSYARHAEQRRIDRQRYLRENSEAAKQSAARTRERRRESGKERQARRRYYAANKEKLLAYEVEYRRRSINRNISCRLRIQINACLRYGRKAAHTETLLGCSFAEMAAHIERQFVLPMCWAKFLQGEIHIDHIIPCSHFDLADAVQQRRCFHFSNLQPLWALDNLRKGNRVPRGS